MTHNLSTLLSLLMILIQNLFDLVVNLPNSQSAKKLPNAHSSHFEKTNQNWIKKTIETKFIGSFKMPAIYIQEVSF